VISNSGGNANHTDIIVELSNNIEVVAECRTSVVNLSIVICRRRVAV